MIHKFIEGSILFANEEGMKCFSPNSYDKRYKVLKIHKDNGYECSVELLHIETNQKIRWGGNRLYYCFESSFESLDINNQIEELLKNNKFKNFVGITTDNKKIEINFN